MIDRTASLRAIITGRGNSADFTDGARKSNKRLSHRRMRLAGKEESRLQEEEMRDEAEEQYLLYDFDPYFDSWERGYGSPEQEKHEQRLARRRARYHERKIESQVGQYKALVAQLQKLDKKLEPESRQQLSAAGLLLLLPFIS